MTTLNYLNQALEYATEIVVGFEPTNHPYLGLEDSRGDLSRYPYQDGVSAAELAKYIRLGGKLDSMSHYGISMNMLAELLEVAPSNSAIFADAIKYMIQQETPKWVNWYTAFCRVITMAMLTKNPTEFCNLCYKTKGFLVKSLAQGKFLYKLSPVERRALLHNQMKDADVDKQVEFIVKMRKEPIPLMTPRGAWKALGRSIPYDAISNDENRTILHPHQYDAAMPIQDEIPIIQIEGKSVYEIDGNWWVEIPDFALVAPISGVRKIGNRVVFKTKYFNAVWGRVLDRHVSSPYWNPGSCKDLWLQLDNLIAAKKKKEEEAISLLDVKLAGFCITGTRRFLSEKMPFVGKLLRGYTEWQSVPTEVLKARFKPVHQVWAGYESYLNYLIKAE